MYGTRSSSQFFDVILTSSQFPLYIHSMLEGKSVGYGDVMCDYYDPGDLDPWDDQTPYEGVKFSVIKQEHLYPDEIVDCEGLYDLIEQACHFYVEDYPQNEEAEKLFLFVQKERTKSS